MRSFMRIWRRQNFAGSKVLRGLPVHIAPDVDVVRLFVRLFVSCIKSIYPAPVARLEYLRVRSKMPEHLRLMHVTIHLVPFT